MTALEEASAEHLAWLKQIHCTLLFHDQPWNENEDFDDDEEILVEKVADQLGEGRAAIERLKTARYRMKEMARGLTAKAARGERLDPKAYLAFMDTVETYYGEARQTELLLHQALVATDPLTGLHNRHGMTRNLRREWVRAARTGNPACLALADLDRFKSINDTYGHPAGDLALTTTARFFLDKLRPYDMVYRYGGEEFLFCLPNTPLRHARRVLERLRLMLAKLPIETRDGRQFGLTMSIGLTELSPETLPQAAIDRADAALQVAKRNGRNQVCLVLPQKR